MALPDLLARSLALPVIGAPMFILSGPDLVVAQCTSGIVGTFPALNARPQDQLDGWIRRIKQDLDAARREGLSPVAPFGVNLIVHPSNDRLAADLDTCVGHEVPIVITSLHEPRDVVARVHAYGGLVFHDVTNIRHARKAAAAGVDGLILVCAGAGGHAGTLSPFALVHEVREVFDGLIVLAGAITDGSAILAAQAIGCDLAYMGTRFIATQEANADARYKRMIVESSAADIVYTPFFTGVPGSYLKPSIQAAGLDPDDLGQPPVAGMSFAAGQPRPKVWKDIWGAGQGVGNIHEVAPARTVVRRLKQEYEEAASALARAMEAVGPGGASGAPLGSIRPAGAAP